MKTRALLLGVAAAVLAAPIAYAQTGTHHHRHHVRRHDDNSNYSTPQNSRYAEDYSQPSNADQSAAHDEANREAARRHEEEQRNLARQHDQEQRDLARQHQREQDAIARQHDQDNRDAAAQHEEYNREVLTRENIRKYRDAVEARHRYHYGESWRAPSDWHYRHWTYGDRLPHRFYARDYWITNYGAYGLNQPPYGYAWVRYGDDAALIDLDTGEIIRIEYNMFY